MTKFKELNFPPTYKYSSDSDYIPLEFYELTFPVAESIDILLGYFSSNAFKVLSNSFAEFIYQGGSLRIITNHFYSLKDKNNLIDFTNLENEDELLDIFGDLERLERELSDYGRHFFDCLKFLIKNKRLQILPVKFNEVDLAHCKKMILYDGSNYISTDGSINFTLNALTKNSESFELNVPWEGDVFKKRIKDEIKNFNRIFNKEHPDYEYISPDKIITVIQKVGRDKKEIDLLEDSIKLDNSRYSKKVEKLLTQKKKRFNIKIKEIKISKEEPFFPFDEPRDYQKQAYQNWKKNKRKGLFAMATGTGKTITALNCILEEYKLFGYYRFVVLVPSLPLSAQWSKEIKDKFNFTEVIECNSKNPNWEEFLRTKLKNILFSNNGNVCILSTYATFKTQRFQNAFFSNFTSLIDSFTLIADEAHTMGASGIIRKLPTTIPKRIGLSATPDRVYDELGSNALSDFFRATSPNYTFRYSMKEAIEDGILCEYEYHPIFFNLTSHELNIYKKFTEKLRKYIDPKTGKYKNNPAATALLIQRKNVIHKAEQKLPKLESIIKTIGPNSFNYAFIYVPEGYEPDYQSEEDFNLTDDDNRLINLYTQHLYDNFNLKLKSFTGETPNREEILNLFKKGRYQALLAMKCLDEGIDIPRAQYAIFCSSTGNPRQFVQRRGRVLRMHDDKEKAIIYDLIASPVIDDLGLENDQKKTEENIFKSELRRVINFAALADNCHDIIKGETLKICKKLDIDLHKEILTELELYN